MKLDKTTWFQVLISIFLVMIWLIGCASNSEPVTPIQKVSPVTVKATPTLPHTPASSVVKPNPTATPISTPIQTVSPLPAELSPTPSPTPLPSPTPAPSIAEPTPMATPTSYYYGLVYAYPKNDWTEADRLAIRDHLEYLRELGINTIVQVFSSHLIGTGREEDWLILLDEAERANIHVIARLWPLNDWNGQEFDFETTQSFLAVVQDHPALLAYLGLHEPLEQFDSDQLREFYAGLKNLAPKLAISHYLGNMAWFENSQRFPNRDFTAGICDICIVWYYPARYVNGQPAFQEDLVRETLQENRKLVDERAPDAELWFLGQTYAQGEHRAQLRMPTPDEMETIYAIAEQERVDGFLWYPWTHGNYDQVLSDPEMEPQRQAVRHIYESYILRRTTP